MKNRVRAGQDVFAATRLHASLLALTVAGPFAGTRHDAMPTNWSRVGRPYGHYHITPWGNNRINMYRSHIYYWI